MGNHYRRHPGFLLDTAQFQLHLLAQLGVEVGQGFVQQQQGWFDDEGTRQSHALPLTARHGQRIAVGQMTEMNQLQRSRHPAFAFGLVDLAHLKPESNVLGYGHVHEKRIALKDDSQPALAGGHAGQILAIQQDAARSRRGKAGDHLQGGGLAASRRAKQRHKAAFLDAQVQILDSSNPMIEFC